VITVQDILEIPELDLRLLAGKGSIGNPVRWVHISEVPDPTRWLKGGELLLTTGYGFVGDEARQVEQIKRLIDHNTSGLGFGTGFSFDKVPPALVTVAEEYGYPLFEVPYHIPFLAITEAVASKIVNEQYSLLQRSLAVHEKLTKIVLEEKGLEAILSTLAALVGCSAVLFDFHGVVLCEAAYRRRLGADTVADLWRMIGDRRADRQNFALSMEGAGSSVQVYPVVASHRIGAFLAVVKDSGDFSEYDRIILHNVVTVTALELVKKKAVAEMLPEISVSIGIGRPHRQLTDLRQSYYEASYAIRIRRLKDERAVIASFDDLGSYGLLLGLQDTLSLEVFYDSVLGRLRDYDAQNSSDLVKSLASFLEANGHWGDAAEKLFVHRHTLRYRMKRVEEITGRDLGSSQDRMEFWLALKARELIDQSRKGKQTTA